MENSTFLTFLDILSAVFIFSVGAGTLLVVTLYVIDRTQTTHAIRRNYPVIGRLRYLFEDLGKYFRQYFFAMDREEMPFNRAQRAWVYRSAKNLDTTIAFGSTRDIKVTGTVLFASSMFPVLDRESVPPGMVTVGPYCRQPYLTNSLFNISGMSYGAISKPAILALSQGAQSAGCWLNTGEGGLSPWHLEGGCDIVFQIGTAKYGVRDEAGQLDDDRLAQVASFPQVKMFEIKLSQGAKPGKGGILPGIKVNAEIAAIRGIPEGLDSISPNRHTDINSVGDLLDVIHRVRSVTGKPVGFKAVIGDYDWLEDLCHEIAVRGPESAPDFITIDSADGGTGAAPQALIDHMGLPISESLPDVVDILIRHGLKARIKINASGKLITPAGVAWALCAGADFVCTARGFMFALGCIQSLSCNKNNCPTGIATHNPNLQKGLVTAAKAVRVTHYARNMVHEVGVIAHSCGVDEPRHLTRRHARIVMPDGVSRRLDDLHPIAQPAMREAAE